MQDTPYDKLRDGQRILASAGDDHYRLAAALLKLHGALENRLRELLAHRLPERASEITDPRLAQWNDLLALAEEHLGLGRADSEFIHQANRYRIPLAHGGDFTWNRRGLAQYEELIRAIWANGSRSGPALPPLQAEMRQPPPRSEPPPKPSRPSARRPWFRASGVYLALFILALPLWGLLILTDRRQGSLAKAFALLSTVAALAFGVYLLSIYLPQRGQAAEAPLVAPAALPGQKHTASATPAATPKNESQPQPSAQPAGAAADAPAAAPAQTGGNCVIAWKPYPHTDIFNKNRAMVWDEILSKQIPRPAMEFKQFIQQVVEQNPGLVEDGYVFKKGKVYLLPVCE